jgi:hypothetical protein
MKNEEIIELNSSEMISIDGGNLFHALGEAAGFIVGTFVSLVAGFKDGITGAEKK